MSWTLSAFADEAAPTCDAQIAALQRAGLKHIDIRSIEGHNISALPAEIAREVKSKLDDAGITTQMLGSPLGKIDIADDIETDVPQLLQIGFDIVATRQNRHRRRYRNRFAKAAAHR